MGTEKEKTPKTIDTLEEPLRSLFKKILSAYRGQAFGTIKEALDEEKSDKNKPFFLRKPAECIKEKKIALCVGAGVTSYFVGDWRNLLQKLLGMRCHSVLRSFLPNELDVDGRKGNRAWAIKNFDGYIGKLKDPFLSASTNTLEIGEYLLYDPNDYAPKIGTEDESNYREIFFAEQVRHVIYASIEEKIKNSSIEGYFVKLYKEKIQGKEEDIFRNGSNDGDVKGILTLVAVVKLCIKKNIKTIVTYNFDMILDKLIASNEVRELFGENSNVAVHVHTYFKDEPIRIWGNEKSEEIVNIYHVHGVLDKELDAMPIIFSENSYQSYQKTILNWSNIRLADVMLKYNVLCIGFSGDDANFRMLRRFLEESMANPIMGKGTVKKHLYVMRSCGNEIQNFINCRDFNSKAECALASIKTYLELVSNYFVRQLGTEIIWSDGYIKMAEQINWLSENTLSRK